MTEQEIRAKHASLKEGYQLEKIDQLTLFTMEIAAQLARLNLNLEQFRKENKQ